MAPEGKPEGTLGGDVEAGIGLTLFSIVMGSVGLFYTVRSGLNRVERDRLNWLESEYPKRVLENEEKAKRINELNEELFAAYRRRAAQSE